MMVNPLPRLNTNNSAFNMMKASDSLAHGTNSKAAELDMVRNSLAYKANSLMEASQKKATDENIKRTFNVVA